MSKAKTNSKISVELSLDEYFENNIMAHLTTMLEAKIESSMESQVEAIVRCKVEELANKEFNKIAKSKVEEFFTKAHHKTDYYGHPTGQSESLIEVLTKKFGEYLDQSVDDNGQPSSYSKSLKRSQWMLNKLAHEPLQKAIEETVQGIAKKAKEQIQSSVSRYIAEQLAPTISVPQLKQ